MGKTIKPGADRLRSGSGKEGKGKLSVSSTRKVKPDQELLKYKAKCEQLSEELRLQKEKSVIKKAQYNELSGVIHQFFSSGYFLLSEKGKILESNLHGLKILGKTSAQLINRNFSDFIPARYKKVFNSFFQTLIKTHNRSECEVEVISKGRSTSEVRISGVSTRESGNCYIIVSDISDQKILSAKLIDTGKRYHELIGNLIDGYVYVDMEGYIIECNEAFRKMVGYEEKELLRLTYRDLTPERWYDFEQKIVHDQIIKVGYSSVYEKEYIRKDGTVFPVELRTMLVKDEHGKEKGMWGIVRDITERNLSRKQLIESEFWLKESQRVGKLGSYSFDINKDRFSCSETLDTILGITDNPEKNTELWLKIVAPEYRDEMKDYLMNFVIGEKRTFNREYEIVRINDQERRWVWGYGSLGFDDLGNPVTMFGVIQDITGRKKAEETIRRSEIEYRETLNSIPDWIIVVDADLRLTTINSSFREVCLQQGMFPDFLGKHITGLTPFFSSIMIEAIEHVFHSANSLFLKEKVELLERSFFAEFRIIPLVRNQTVDKAIIVIRDKTREKEIEELKTRNTEQKEFLLREIHHRVKNNLSIVISLLNFQLRKHEDSSLSMIVRDLMMQIRSMALIHEHLYFSEAFDKIPLSAYIKSIASYVSGFFPENQIHVRTELDLLDTSIEKALPIGLIVNELLSNSYKYAFPGSEPGEILIEMRSGEDDQVILKIMDNGIGLPPSLSIDSEETLGLYILSLLVKQLEGTYDIIRNHGTIFIIRFRNTNNDQGI